MTIAVAILLSFGALFFTLFVRLRDVPDPLPVSPIEHLEDRKRAIYENLRDLQFEYRLGKLSDDDYRLSKQALQKELAGVLAETEETVRKLGLKTAVKAPAQKSAAPVSAGSVCAHCGASFPQRLKYCGQCGKAIA
jgi:hypothetical protein